MTAAARGCAPPPAACGPAASAAHDAASASDSTSASQHEVAQQSQQSAHDAGIDSTQPAGGADADESFSATQLAPAIVPAARFTLNGGVDGSHDGVPPQQFQLPAEHGERLGFARKIAGGEERDGGTIYLTACNTLGISRTNGSVQFDERRGVVLHRLVRDGIPTFHNGALLHEASATLAHGDTIGFGSTNRLAPTAETVTYTADLSSLGRLGTSDAQRMPPPALSRAPAAGASAETRWVYYQPAEGAPAPGRHAPLPVGGVTTRCHVGAHSQPQAR